MTYDTSTQAGRDKRMNEMIEGYKQSRNWGGMARLAGLSRHDFDYTEADHGEAPQGAKWN